MPYDLRIVRAAIAELEDIRAYGRKRILDEIKTQLTHEPLKATRKRKSIPNVCPGFEHDSPLWQLRIGRYRVFYDVDSENMIVFIRAVREKPPGRTTKEVVE